jgi:hypothetical protein
LQKPIFLAALLCSLTGAQAAEPSSAPATPAMPAAQHPLVGSWRWQLPGTACTETWQYQSEGSRSASSGAETTRSHYEVSPLPSLLGFYRVSETVIESNGKPDCAGDLHPAAEEPVTRFIQFSPKHEQLIVCREESLKACFGPLKRVAP